MGTLIKIGAVLLAVGVGAQTMMVDYAPPADNGRMIVGGEAGPIFEAACADCHTHDTTWPWYSKVPPVSFWISDHVQEGREHFNLSAWDAYDARRADHKLEEMIEMVEDGEMPLKSYTWGHAEARLTDEQRETLIAWAREMRAGIQAEMNAAAGESAEGGDAMDADGADAGMDASGDAGGM